MPLMFRRLGSLAVAVALTAAPPAFAQSAVPGSPEALAEAKRLYAEGAALFKEKRFREAAERFQAAYDLDPSPILLYNLARSAEETGDAQGAVEHYQAYLARYPQAEDRDEVQRRIRVLEAVSRQQRTGRLFLEGAPAGATVTFNGAPAPSTEQDGGWALPPGRYAVRVEPGGFAQDVEVRPDETLRVPYAGDGSDGEGRPYRLWGWVSVGSAVALAGGAVFFGLQASAAEDDFHSLSRELQENPPNRLELAEDKDAAQDDARSNALVANILWGVAGAVAATGVTLLILDSTSDPAPSAAIVPLPGGLGLTGSF